MAEFLSSYGLWIVLAVIFIAMHRFGMGCCGGGHQHGATRRESGTEEGAKTPPGRTTTAETKPVVAGRRSAGSCH